MYRASKYNISQASLEFFAKRFNEAPNYRNLEWRYINEESLVNDGYFIDVGTGKSLGYDVQFVHVKCRVSGTGHIRLRLRHKKHTEGNWINRDPAAVADTTSGNVRSLWCEDGYLIAYDPSWIFTDLYSS